MASRDVATKKRAREDNGDEQDDATTQLIFNRSKELYKSMKAACTARKFEEAVAICSAALNEEGLSKPSRTKFLLARSSMYSQMENAFPMAIKDAKQAIILSPTHAMVSNAVDSGFKQKY